MFSFEPSTCPVQKTTFPIVLRSSSGCNHQLARTISRNQLSQNELQTTLRHFTPERQPILDRLSFTYVSFENFELQILKLHNHPRVVQLKLNHPLM